MKFEPPEGSKIKVVRDINSTSYMWENGSKGIAHYGATAFLIFWLCGWTVGGFFAIGAFLFGESMPIGGRLFLLAWLGGWLIGEVAVISTLYFSLRPQKPSVLSLSSRHIKFETGTRPYNLGSQDTRNPVAFLKKYKNKTYEVDTSQLTNLTLERIGERLRLTFDYGVERVEIAEALSEPEKEWLYEVLQEHR